MMVSVIILSVLFPSTLTKYINLILARVNNQFIFLKLQSIEKQGIIFSSELLLVFDYQILSVFLPCLMQKKSTQSLKYNF